MFFSYYRITEKNSLVSRGFDYFNYRERLFSSNFGDWYLSGVVDFCDMEKLILTRLNLFCIEVGFHVITRQNVFRILTINLKYKEIQLIVFAKSFKDTFEGIPLRYSFFSNITGYDLQLYDKMNYFACIFQGFCFLEEFAIVTNVTEWLLA